MDVAQALEDILEALVSIQKDVSKLKTTSVSGSALRKRVKDTHKKWLPVAGVLETINAVEAGHVQEVSDAWTTLVRLTTNARPKKHYKAQLKTIIAKTEGELLHRFIKLKARPSRQLGTRSAS
jgi:hypothetical protein